jgi:hypothetical protein
MSVVPPAAKGTMMRIGRDGKACARAGTASVAPARASAARRVIGHGEPPGSGAI